MELRDNEERERGMTDISERERGERMKDHPLVCRGFGTYWNQKKNQPTPENLKERERERECVRGFVPKPSACFLHRQLPSKGAS